MKTEDLLKLWDEADSVQTLNDIAREDDYWIRAGMDHNLSQMKIIYERLQNKPYQFPLFDPPYLILPDLLFNQFLGLSIRKYGGSRKSSINEVGFRCYTAKRTVVERDRFTPSAPIVLTEGPMDAEALSLYYPFCMASLGSRPPRKLQYALSVLTTTVIYIPDNDETGEKQAGKLQSMARKDKIPIHDFRVVRIPDELKDPGSILEHNLEKKTISKQVENIILTEVKKHSEHVT